MNLNFFRIRVIYSASKDLAPSMASILAIYFPHFYAAAPHPMIFIPRARLFSYHRVGVRSAFTPPSSSSFSSSFDPSKGNDFLPSADESSRLATNRSSTSKFCSENTYLHGKPATYTEPQQAKSFIPSDDCNTCCYGKTNNQRKKAVTCFNVKEESVLQPLSHPKNRKFSKNKAQKQIRVKKLYKLPLKHGTASPADSKQLDLFNYEHDIYYKEDQSFITKAYKKKREMIHRKHKHITERKSKVQKEKIPFFKPFDICSTGKINHDIDKPVYNPLHFEREKECSSQRRNHVIRRGMVLLKNYLTSTQQIEIVKQCRVLGLGPGGFYRPGFEHGGKLHLHMLCLGLSWDPSNSNYSKIHPVYKSETPEIPEYFSLLVKDSISCSQEIIRGAYGVHEVENILPTFDPNICIVNFYKTTGKLGLHQDRDESKESLAKGLPVVSFSIGDCAEFLFGDERDVEKAKNIDLESGDVLIFGGESRHVFHGVSCIFPNTAPEFLCKGVRLHPGRLNLTFRQY